MTVQPAAPFGQRSILLIFLIGGIAFAAMLALLIISSGRQQGSPTGTNAFSHSAIGHRAFVELIDRAGIPVTASRGEIANRVQADTLVIAAEPPAREVVAPLLQDLEEAGAALVVLPKWEARASPTADGWVGRARLIDRQTVREVLQSVAPGAKIHRPGGADQWPGNPFAADPVLTAPQLIQSPWLRPIVAGDDGMLLAEVEAAARPLWILSDPDVIANHGIGHGDNAAFVLELVETLRPGGGTVVVDQTLHGFRRTESLWRTILEPPFLPTAIQAGLATMLLAWAAAVRFGRPDPMPRAIDPGTSTLVAIGARLLRDRRHGRFLIETYAAAVVSDVTRRLRLGRPASDAELAERLDRIGENSGTRFRFSELMSQVAALPANDGGRTPDILRVARRLDQWKRDLTHGS